MSLKKNVLLKLRHYINVRYHFDTNIINTRNGLVTIISLTA